MAPRRKVEELRQKSVWDEQLVSEVLVNSKHRDRMWNWLLKNPEADICDIPFDTWRVAKVGANAIRNEFVRFTTKVVERNESIRGDTTKLLLELQDGHRIETVIMRHVAHATVCVSSQIGCQMGCRFCATGTMGIIGNLTSGEILEQLVRADAISKIRNVVFMGMGEPLNNYEHVKRAVLAMTDEKRFGLSGRHVTVSTVGVLKSMQRMTEDMAFVNLALSLHAPNQEVRLKIVPAAAAHKLDKLLDAVDLHIERNKQVYAMKRRNSHGEHLSQEEVNQAIHQASERTGVRRPNKVTGVMIEYILIKNINAREEHAIELANLLACRRDHILLNLIPYNPTSVAEDYEPPTEEDVQRFHEICTSEPFRIHTRVRREKGQDIAGACGQLALVKPTESLPAAAAAAIAAANARASATASGATVTGGGGSAAQGIELEDYTDKLDPAAAAGRRKQTQKPIGYEKKSFPTATSRNIKVGGASMKDVGSCEGRKASDAAVPGISRSGALCLLSAAVVPVLEILATFLS